ncbi:MAG: DUF4230 domain-containing protein [Anaerolineales bacterium]|nr:DUF4230 domain-containing protein [Anaerolineales bacterium]
MMKNDNALRAWVLTIGLLLIVAVAAIIGIALVNRAARQAQQALQPVNDMTSNLGTQVANVLNPTPTVLPDPVTVVYQVRTLARLETIQYSVEKVITAEVGQDVFAPLFGDKLLFVAHGIVIAGVDMMKIGPQDMWLENGVLYVRLPEPEVFIATLDNEKSYVYDRDTGIFTHGDVNLETTARQVAEDEIEKAALEDGILEQARTNAEVYIERLLRDLGYDEIVFLEPETQE